MKILCETLESLSHGDILKTERWQQLLYQSTVKAKSIAGLVINTNNSIIQKSSHKYINQVDTFAGPMSESSKS